MVAEYKLTYFDIRGLGDVSRQLFALAGVEYEDDRVIKDIWPTLEEDTPFGQLPVLETNGIRIPQSLAIARYLANKFGFAGKTAEEKALTDAFGYQFKDFYEQIKPCYFAKIGLLTNDPDIEKALIPTRNIFFKILQKYLKKFEIWILGRQRGHIC